MVIKPKGLDSWYGYGDAESLASNDLKTSFMVSKT